MRDAEAVKERIRAALANRRNGPKMSQGRAGNGEPVWILQRGSGVKGGTYMRWFGHADDVLPSIGHAGWYVDSERRPARLSEDQSETMRGAVFQLPARKGRKRYLAAVSDPWNDDFFIIVPGVEADAEEAAREADYYARVWAEQECDYRYLWNRARAYEDAGNELSEIRDAARALIEAGAPEGSPLRRVLCKILDRRRDLIAKRARILDDYGHAEGWADALAG